MARVAVVGSYGTGLSFLVPRVPNAGETIVAGLFEIHEGGKGSNQAVGAARLGAESHLITAIGHDLFAEQALALWRREGVDASHVVQVDRPTMAGAILVEETGQNRIAIAPGALDLMTPEIVDTFADEIAAADVLLVQLEIPVEAAAHALRLARDAGVTTVFNPAPARPLEAHRGPERSEGDPLGLLRLADFLTPNESEAATLTGFEGEPEVLARALLERGVRQVVMTLGADGALLVSPEGVIHVPGVRVEDVVDTTGAGDAFNAAFAVALAEGREPVEAARWGCAAGAAAVQRWGVIPSLPRREELPLS
jgi:ribokinase